MFAAPVKHILKTLQTDKCDIFFSVGRIEEKQQQLLNITCKWIWKKMPAMLGEREIDKERKKMRVRLNRKQSF